MTSLDDVIADPPDLSDRRIVCLPDFFVDHLVDVDDLDAWTDAVREIADAGGGNLPGVPQSLSPGGQSANVARHLAGLGADAALVAPAGPGGRLLADRWLGSLGVDLDGMVEAATSLTVALETPDANVMVNDAAALADVTFDALGGPGILDGADAAVLANWAQVGDGDAFAREVLEAAADRGVPVLFDPGDPRPHGPSRLLDVVAEAPPAVLAVNEAEAAAFGLSPSDVPSMPRGRAYDLVIHTADDATLVRSDGKTVTAPAFDVHPTRRTGAGDAFHAGLLVGRLLDLDAWDELRLGHAVAAAQISTAASAVGWEDVRAVVDA